MKKFVCILLLLSSMLSSMAENGYDLWLRYKVISNKNVLDKYKTQVQSIFIEGESPTLSVIKKELSIALKGMLGKEPAYVSSINNGTLIIAKSSSTLIRSLNMNDEMKQMGEEGFLISSKTLNGKKNIYITGSTEAGILYGVFHFLRLMQTNQDLASIQIISVPKINLRLLNHWDNLDRTVERGYAGFSLWNWHTLPSYIDQRYIDYARANASIGINGTVLTNVNANATVLTPAYLDKVAALANVFRPYGIKVYLTARFSAPVEIGGLSTADPLDKNVQAWWNQKVKEIYERIPDFGGFLVKANSEGQPGPQNYDRNHADGANMLADAVSPFNGIVMWRAFVYSNEVPDDRHKQAYNEFVPLDGKFRPNVMVQVKNGAIDFQPREPFHPLFGAMPKTPLMMEFQITQEYLGQATNLVYLAPMFKEVLDSDTYRNGKGSTVAKIIDGSIDQHKLTGIAGVSNIGNDINWTGHPFGQANWYAYGRLAWDHTLSSSTISNEWLAMTFTHDKTFLSKAGQIMLRSHEITVQYSTPLGLHHLMGTGHHYGPAPWISDLSRADWNPVYYHRADSAGIGFDRTVNGSGALSQYAKQVQDQWKDPKTIPEKYLLWFHHVPWNFKMRSGRTLWEELCYSYNTGVDSVEWMKKSWQSLRDKVDEQRFNQVNMLLEIQLQEAKWWRDACLLYFQQFSKRPIPEEYAKPENTLEYYKNLKFPYAPGN